MPGKTPRNRNVMRPRLPGFNEAQAEMPGKTPLHQGRAAQGEPASMRPRRKCLGKLQQQQMQAQQLEQASMRPRRKCLGKPAGVVGECAVVCGFNEAQAEMPGKTRDISPYAQYMTRLQ